MPGCAKREDNALRRLVPGLTAEVAAQLTRDDGDFIAYAQEAGVETLRQSLILLKETLPLDDPDAYTAASRQVLPAMKKIAAALDSVYGMPTLLRECEILSTPGRGIPYRKLHIAQEEIFNDPALTAEAKLDTLLGLLPMTEAPDMLLLRPSFKYPIAVLYSSINDDENHLRYLREALADARDTESHGWECQLLGSLGAYYVEIGDVETGMSMWDESLQIANRHKFPSLSARIASFYGWYYLGEGRLSLAQELLNEAQDLCRRYKGGYLEIRYVLAAMEFQAELGSWEVIERLYKRGRALERQYIETPINSPNEDLKHIISVFKVRLSTFEARLLMARGDVDQADPLFESLRKPARQIRGRLEYPGLLYHWADGLVKNGRAQSAMPIIEEGLRDSRDNYLPWLAADFAILEARTHRMEGRFDEALASLDEFEEFYKESSDDKKKHLRRDWTLKEAIRARVHLDRGDRDAAVSAMESGLERLESSLLGLDKGVQGYIWLSRCAEFRDLLGDLTAHDANLSYGAELYWRSLYPHLGGRDPHAALQPWALARGADPASSIEDHLRSLAGDAHERISHAGGVHLAYSVTRSAVLRWIIDGDGIRFQTLDIDPSHLRDLVSASWRDMSKDPGDGDAPVPRSLSAGLYSLAETLLPPELMSRSRLDPRQALFITCEGYLSRIPFEALNVGSEGQYLPLLDRFDVAYLRHVGKRVTKARAGGGAILVTEAIPARLRDRYPLAGELVHAFEECAAVARLNPDATFLHGSSVTKSDVMSSWKHAKFIYLAAHVLRDPEVPYLALIPVSATGGRSGPDAAYVDISDIRSQSLNGCDVVVLSGCSSGAPYLTSYAAAPSLGDVFIDAGAGAAVQTFWAVADDNARRLMTSYVETWASEGVPSVKGLNDVRRAALLGSHGIRHPFSWASYSIKLQGL